MQTGRIVQAVILMLIVAIAASCAASKEYGSKLFATRTPAAKDSLTTAPRFLELNNADTNKEGWVTTDIIMGRDTVSKTLALDKLAKIYPAAPLTTDTITNNEQTKTAPVIADTKSIPAESEPVAKNANPGEVRTKRTRE